MKKKPAKNAIRLAAIFIHFQPERTIDYSALGPGFKAGMIALSSTPPGKVRNKEDDAYNTEREWTKNLSFVSAICELIPDGTILKAEAESLLLKMFGKGFSADRLQRFGTAERHRTRASSRAAWRLLKKVRKYYGLPALDPSVKLGKGRN
jgi:hypothetical protein